MNTRSLLTALVCAGAVLITIGSLRAAEDDAYWQDRSIMLKENAALWMNNRRVSWLDLFLPGVVHEVRGEWLGLGNSTWVKKAGAVRVREAPAYYTGMIQRQPDSSRGYELRGLAWLFQGENRNALKDFEEATRIRPTSSQLFLYRGKAKYQLHRYADAVDDFSEAIRLDPNNLVAYNDRGVAFDSLGKEEAAVADFDTILARKPRDAEAYCNRGATRVDQNRLDDAMADYDHAIEYDPKHWASYCNRGKLRSQLGDYPNALADFDKARELAPYEWAPLYGWASIRATSPWPQLRDGAGAKAAALKACELAHWNDFLPIGALAAACAELEDFDAAIHWETKALELIPKDKVQIVREHQQRLELYQQHKPYYEPEKKLKAAETSSERSL